MRKLLTLSAVLAGLLAAASVARAGEGMWLLNAPLPGLKAEHGFEPEAKWLEHVQKSSIRFNNGGSGSFVSADGLMITNHHVASDALYKLSDATHNYLRDGFHAKTRDQELKCVDLELNVLMEIEDVTAQVQGVIKTGMSSAEAFAARRAKIAEIEKASLDKTGLRSDVVTLYQGGQYHLYRYKKYTDVRLVFAPEQQAAFFGGDPDNFEYPRFNLDCTFLRAYEDGKPAKIQHYFTWSRTGAADGELVFVSGHPGSTSRLLTAAELEYMRDVRVPNGLRYLKHREVLLGSFGSRSPENARIAKDDMFSIQNSRKVFDGRIAALLDEQIWKDKRADEAGLLAFAKGKAEFADLPQAIEAVAQVQKELRGVATRANLLENYRLDSELFGIARTLVRHATEKSKPSGERLREFRDSNRASLEMELFSEMPIYEELEKVKIAGNIAFAAAVLGGSDSLVAAIAEGKTPSVRAAELVDGSKLKDVAFRKQVYAMTPEEVAKLDDPMIRLALKLDPEARALRKMLEEKKEIVEQAHAKLAKARFAKDGTSVYPDATFTLRLSYGLVKGYNEGGKSVPPFTVLGGKFERSELMGGKEPFDLPKTWVEARSRMKLDTPYNFVSTCDIIGGNSGSPTLNKKAEFVGIIFDGNIQSLVGDYAYSDLQARALSVDSRGIVEALRSVYGADELIRELLP
ncbi:S46 family peptidase [Nibricoccus sp. IMCC34717]|uniref:S46 family peptidase n=1 Tax=Nibricoccus sp. IMCC34717 TaxID=3034021 RepID=UPI0038507B17